MDIHTAIYLSHIKYEYKLSNNILRNIFSSHDFAEKIYRLDKDSIVLLEEKIKNLSLEYSKIYSIFINKSLKDDIESYCTKNAEKIKEIKAYFWTETSFPLIFNNLNNPPLLIYVLGNEYNKIVNAPLKVCIVGSRKNSPYGERLCQEIVECLSKYKIPIISGMAYGIDNIAQTVAFRNNNTSLAVLACGVNKCYPFENIKLYYNLRERGALISEYPPEIKIKPYFFRERNRLMTGLANFTVIPEAGIKSGSMLSASYTLEQGKDLMVCPGNIYNENSKGCNLLAKEGAYIYTEIEDLIDLLKDNGLEKCTKYFNFYKNTESIVFSKLNKLENKLYNLLLNEDLSIPNIISYLKEYDDDSIIQALFRLKYLELIKEKNSLYYAIKFD